MASKFLRRSGVAVCLISELIEFVPDAIIQVGIGSFHEEVPVMKQAWPHAKFTGFEANPNIRIRDYPGTLIRKAISNRAGSVDLHFQPRHKDGSSLFPPKHAETSASITVPCVTLDSLDLQAQQALLWLDCEGSELNVLRGAENFIERSVAVINVEMTSKPSCEGWCSPESVHDWLCSHGFYRQWVHTNRSSAGQCDVIYVRSYLFQPEYCCCPCQVNRYKRGR